MVMAGMMVAQKVRRNTKITITTSTTVSIRVNCTSVDRRADGLRAVGNHVQLDRRAGSKLRAAAEAP